MSNFQDTIENTPCEICGNKSTKCFEVRLGGETHIFDSFECAMRALSTRCGYCNTQIRGHSVVLGKKIYCSYQCANDDHNREHEKRVPVNQQENL